MAYPEIWTVGHWNQASDDLLATLGSASINLVADVRSVPGSARSPQYNREEMVRWLDQAGITYRHLGSLGGRRGRQPVDPDRNAGWHNDSFRNYADYTTTAEFAAGLAELEALAANSRVVILCGEPVPWRCHRSIIADALAARGWTVWHLLAGAAPIRHELGRWGASPVVGDDHTLTYPAV